MRDQATQLQNVLCVARALFVVAVHPTFEVQIDYPELKRYCSLKMTMTHPSHPNTHLPVPNSSDSYWRSEPSWLDELQSTPHLPSTCDILIVGGGFAGVATAYHILKTQAACSGPKPSVVLLEARQICSGATGRNGGHIKLRPSTIAGLVDEMGMESVETFHAFVRQNVYAVKEVIEEEGIDCESELRRSWDVCLDAGEAEEVKKRFAKLKESGMATLEDIETVGEKFAERVSVSFLPVKMYELR